MCSSEEVFESLEEIECSQHPEAKFVEVRDLLKWGGVSVFRCSECDESIAHKVYKCSECGGFVKGKPDTSSFSYKMPNSGRVGYDVECRLCGSFLGEVVSDAWHSSHVGILNSIPAEAIDVDYLAKLLRGLLEEMGVDVDSDVDLKKYIKENPGT